jgi:hypothetical protein
MRLSGELSAEFQEALMDAFNKESLAQMVYLKLNENLEDIVADGSMKDVTFNLIQELAKQDRVLELAEGALKANSTNRKLKTFVDKIKTHEIDSQAVSLESSEKTELSPIERLKLMKTLNSLLPQQLEEIIVSVKPPGGVIPPLNAAQGDRTAALIKWAEAPGGVGLRTIQEILELVSGG